jgi:hypothetical protein
MAQIQKGTTYSAGNPTVTVDNLNAHVDNATLLPGSITEQLAITTAEINSLSSAQLSVVRAGSLRSVTLAQAVTGALSPAANGQLLIGNATTNQFAKAMLTAGSNLTVTNAAGAITLAAAPLASFTAQSLSGTGNQILSPTATFSQFYKYTIAASAVQTIKLPGANCKNGATLNFKVTFSGPGSATINFQPSSIGTNIVTATASSGTQEFVFVALQDNPTQVAHWGSFN